MKTIKTFAEPEDFNMFSNVMENHQKCIDNGHGNVTLMTYLHNYYQQPKDFETTLYTTQILQADCLETAISHFRSNRGRCLGSTYWQVNDCNPVISWATIDYYGRWKASHYVVKRCYAPTIINLRREEKEITFTLSKRAFAFFNVYSGEFQVESGDFAILIGASSRDIKLIKTVKVNSTDTATIPDYSVSAPAYYTADLSAMKGAQFEAVLGRPLPSAERDTSKPIDIYCCLDDARHTKWGGKICNLIEGMMSKFGSDANGDGKMIAAMATQIPIRNFIAMSMGVFSVEMADGLLMILNDDKSSFKGVMKIIGRIGPAITKLPALIKSI